METEKQAVKIKKIIVKLISSKSNTALIEYLINGNIYRCYVPKKSLQELPEDHYLAEDYYQVGEDIISMGVPYGIEWESKLSFSVSIDDFANELRKAGIWTKEDVEHNPQAIISALQKVYSIDLSKIFEIAQKYKSERKITK